MSKALENATANLAKLILDACEAYKYGTSQADEATIRELDDGRLPPDIAAAALRFAAARANAIGNPAGTMTPTLALWAHSAAVLRLRLNRNPTQSELRGAMGRSNTAANHAIRRLKAMNMWPDAPNEIESSRETLNHAPLDGGIPENDR